MEGVSKKKNFWKIFHVLHQQLFVQKVPHSSIRHRFSRNIFLGAIRKFSSWFSLEIPLVIDYSTNSTEKSCMNCFINSSMFFSLKNIFINLSSSRDSLKHSSCHKKILQWTSLKTPFRTPQYIISEISYKTHLGIFEIQPEIVSSN